MKWNEAFIKTLREDPSDAELLSHKLMVRAGMIQKLASGIYNYLPLGYRVIKKIENIVREEMATVGASELLMPGVIPAELWKESGRWDYYGAELLRLKDRKNNEFCLGPTHEEVIVDVARRFASSYKDLPLTLYQIQSKFRDEVRPRFGLMRGREFIMKDAYSFHVDDKSLDEMYKKMYNAYYKIFNRCGLTFRPVLADSGAIGGNMTHEFHVLADSGEDTIASCTKCDYAANIELAEAFNNTKKISDFSELDNPLEVETPDKKSIDDVSEFLKVSSKKTIKMLVYRVIKGDEDFLSAIMIRGDLEVNEVKLRNYYAADAIEIPSESELEEMGMVVGFIGAYKFSNSEIRDLLADYSVETLTNAVCGANKTNMHVTNIVPLRDFEDVKYSDFSFVEEGGICPKCKSADAKLTLKRGIEVGQVFKLGDKYTKSMKMTVLDENGKTITPVMGCYGIGVGRTAAAAIEQNHDKDGIIWPVEIAPFEASILLLDPNESEASDVAKSIYNTLNEFGVDVLLDDRDERPGIKFKDCDLIGIPVRIVIGRRGLKDSVVEVKVRKTGDVLKFSTEEAATKVKELLKEL